jgi:hypothetical protein
MKYVIMCKKPTQRFLINKENQFTKNIMTIDQ